MSENRLSSDFFWKSIVVVLLLIVAVQLYLQRSHPPATVAMPEPPGVIQAKATPQAPVCMPPLIAPNQSQPSGFVGTMPGVQPGTGNHIQSAAAMMRAMDEMMDRMMRESQINVSMRSSGSSGADPQLAFGDPVLREEKNAYVVQMSMPDPDKAKITAKVEGQFLTISGEQREEVSNSGAQGGCSYVSSSSTFQSALQLPGPVKDDAQLKIDCSGNTVIISVPKA